MSARLPLWAVAVLWSCLQTAPATGQTLDVTGYALGVSTWADDGLLGPGGAALLGRFRIMPIVRSGPWTLEAAYEHVVSRVPEGGGFAVTTPGGASASGSDWLGVDWSLASSARSSWRHRFDRLSLALDAGPVSVTVGRQAISWATALFLTPADPFAPFDPSDPFRAYRGGVDAVRMRAFTGPFSEVEAVVRAAETTAGATLTALARGQLSRGGWALGGWAGLLHDEGAAALFATGAAGSTAVRGEMAFREDPDGGPLVRATLGADRNFLVDGRDLFAVVEVQYDGYGAATPSDLLRVAGSRPYARGEMQTLGRWTGAAQASFQVHPLVGLDGLVLADLGDGSALVGPGVSWSASSSASLRLGCFLSVGEGGFDAADGLRSAYGSTPTVAYLSLSWFF
ncbi:MAG TPA: hypothetical protein VLA36_04730 [Longimicrobiales bacterium]|nr:hypothetical protein [Longimicrobiales bacterium]